MSSLADKKCVPCTGGVPPLADPELQALLAELDQVGKGWRVDEEHHLAREYEFSDFVSALAFTNQIGALAEEEGHHPDIFLRWGRVGITLWTHKIDGLTESDFVLAAKIEKLHLPTRG